jgi:hypothetical protein
VPEARHLLPAGQIIKCAAVPEGEHPLELSSQAVGSKSPTDGAGRELALDPVLKDGPRRRGRHAVFMDPRPKRAAGLDVREAGPGDTVGVISHPRDSKRSHSDPKGEPPTVANPARPLHDLQPLPRRREPLERAGRRVPGKQLIDGGREPAPESEEHRTSAQDGGGLDGRKRAPPVSLAAHSVTSRMRLG